MINKDFYKSCDLFIEPKREKLKKEYFNDYGYNIYSNRKKPVNNFKVYSQTAQNNVKSPIKR